MRRLSFIVCCLFSLPLPAADGYDALESFAWAEDRAKAVERFLPGSDQHWYFRCLLAQHRGDLAEVDRLIAAWTAARTGDPSEPLARMRLRQAALKVDTTGAAGLAALADELGLVRDHPAPPGAVGAPDDAGRADTGAWTWDALRRHALDEPKAFTRLTAAGLARILPETATPAQRRIALDRITDPTVPGLEAAVIANLLAQPHHPFGSVTAHRHLTEDQLDRIAAAVPRLANDTAHVEARLRRLAARLGDGWRRDEAARATYLAALAAFLPGSDAAGTVRVLALAHQLADARAAGRWDRPLFDRWLAARRQDAADRPHFDADAAARITGLGPAPDGLFDDQLDHWLAIEADHGLGLMVGDEAQAHARFIAAKVLAGVGEVAEWYRQLNDPRAVEELQRRRELALVPGHPRQWRSGTVPTLRCRVKRIDTLAVRIWRLDEEAALRAGRSLDGIPDCAGLAPTATISERCAQPDHLRHDLLVPLKDCAAPGAYVVDVAGADLGLRALIRVGGLHALTTPTADGLEVAVVDDAGQPVPDAAILVGGHRHSVDRTGLVRLPFSSQAGSAQVVVAGNGRAERITLALPAEEYRLSCRLLARHDQFIAGTTATVVLRCILSCQGDVLPLARLTDPVATITWKDAHDQPVAIDTMPLALQDAGDAVLTLRTPERATLVAVEVRGQVRDRTAITDRTLIAGDQRVLSDHRHDEGRADTRIASWLLRRAGDRHVLLARGRAGEPLPRRTATLAAQHALGGTEPITVRTDADGMVDCGPLTDVLALTLTEGEERPWRWTLDHSPQHDRTLVFTSGQRWSCTARTRPAVLRTGDGQVLSVLTDACTARDGFWEMGPLPAGSYRIIVDGRDQDLVVVDGRPVGRHLVAPGQAAVAQAPPPVCQARLAGDALEIRVRQGSPALRVHCLASQALGDGMPMGDERPWHPLATTTWEPADSRFAQRTIGSEERYILDRRGLPRLPGMMLDRPGPLLDPVAPTAAELARDASITGSDRELSSRTGNAKRRALMRGGGSKGSERATALPRFDFLAAPPPVLANLVPDADGIVRVPLTRLGGAVLVEVVACDGPTTAHDRVALPARPLPVRERRLTAPFDPAQPLSVRMDLTALAAGGTLDLPAHPVSGLRLVDSIAALIDLFAATHGDAALQDFRDLGRWHLLDAEARGRLCDRLASHELHLFLARRDPAWCARHLKPYLAGKLQPTLVDRWITGGDLTAFLQADRFTDLNAVERALLAWGLPAAADQERRWLRREADRRTPDAQDFTRFIEAALATVPPGPRGMAFLAAPAGMEHGTTADTGLARDKTSGKSIAWDEKEEMAIPSPAAVDAPTLQTAIADAPKPAAPTRRFYRMPGDPQVLKEAAWYKPRDAVTGRELIRASALWADLAAHDPAKPFLPMRGLDDLDNHHALLAALAFIDLPFAAQPPRWDDIPGGRRLTVAGPTLAVRRTLTDLPAREAGITVRQRLVEAGVTNAQPITDGQCRPRTVYSQELVVANTTPVERLVQVLIQIPAGAVALDGPATRCAALRLEPFGQATETVAFYWPEAGERRQCALAVNDATHRLAVLPPIAWTVRDDAVGGPWTELTDRAAFLHHLRSEDLVHANLSQATWMLSDAAFWREAIAVLRERRHFETSWWSFALHHGDLAGAAESMRAEADALGPAFHSRWLTCDVLDDGRLELLDVAPLVNARAHRHPGSGDGTVQDYYRRLCERLAHRAALDDRDRYTLVCALLLQDRLAEALAQSARIDAQATAGRLPWDHARAWLALAQGDLDAARTIAARHREHPVGHWRERFAELGAQLDEIAGRDAARSGDAAERRALERQADAEPALRLERGDAGHLAITGRNLKACTVRWRGVDLETLFSRTPFNLAADTGDLSLVAPTLEQALALDATGGVRLPIPAAWRGRTAVVEAVGAGARATLLVADDDLDVAVSAGSGLVRVRTRDGKPVVAAYVKVYRRHNGEAVFHKDGYTDRRGCFDHAAVNGTALPAMDRLALYIEAEGHGAVVREVEPPRE